MILQFGSFLPSLLQGFTRNIVAPLATIAGQAALKSGADFVTGLVSRELNRSARNAQEDSLKAALRAAANAVSPTVAIGQTAVPVGGPATGSAFAPATLLPPSIQPPQRVLQTNPNFFPKTREAIPALNGGVVRQPFESVGSQPVGFVSGALAAGRLFSKTFGGARAPIGRRMAGLRGTAIATGTASAVAADAIFAPGVAIAPDIGSFPTSGDPLRIGGGTVPGTITAPTATGLPAVGRYQKEANGFRVQWYFFDGNDMTPIDRMQADMVKRDAIYRLDVFLGKFIKMKSRRMNPMNVRAFFRAGRRVDAGERICRKMFSEKRKQKTGTVRRKSKTKKK